MSDLTAPGADLTKCSSFDLLQRHTPLDCLHTKLAVLKHSYVPPSADHANHPRCKDSRTIANAHLSAAANPHLSRGNAKLLGPQLSWGSSGATSSQEEQKQDLMRPPARPPPPLPSERDPPRRPTQPPPPLPSERDPPRRPAQPPPPLPTPCYGLGYFTTCVQINSHWGQHSNALQHFREWGQTRGLTSLVLDNWCWDNLGHDCKIVPKQPHGFAAWSADTWCWDSLLAQLTDDSLRRIVEGTHGAFGIVACMVRESSFVDKRKRSAADQTTSNVKEVFYQWEFAFLRNNGTVAFLRPSRHSCTIEYYEGVPMGESAVATRQFQDITIPAKGHSSLPEFLFGGEGDITCRRAKCSRVVPTNWFPDMSSLQLVSSYGLKFMEFRNTNHDKRGSAFRPPPRLLNDMVNDV